MPVATPNLDRFLDIQSRALDEAIRRSRARATAADALTGMIGRTRTAPSVLETKIRQWSRGAAAPASIQKMGDFVRPNWTQIRADLELLCATVGEAIVRAMDAHLGAQALAAQEAWPVDLGLSRALLYLKLDMGEMHITGTLGSGAPYTPYIREAVVRTRTGEAVGPTITDRAGKTRSGKRGLPGWKMAYLRKVGSEWVFDAAAYEAGKRAPRALTTEGRKPAKGRPFRDLITRPARATAQAIGADVVAAVNREG